MAETRDNRVARANVPFKEGPPGTRGNEQWLALPLHYLFEAIPVGGDG